MPDIDPVSHRLAVLVGASRRLLAVLFGREPITPDNPHPGRDAEDAFRRAAKLCPAGSVDVAGDFTISERACLRATLAFPTSVWGIPWWSRATVLDPLLVPPRREVPVRT